MAKKKEVKTVHRISVDIPMKVYEEIRAQAFKMKRTEKEIAEARLINGAVL